MKIGLVSLNQKWEDKDYNKSQCENYIVKAKKNEIDLIVFPEMTLTGFSMNTEKIGESQESSSSISFFKELAVKNSTNIVFGIVIEEGGKYYNRLIFIGENGEYFFYSKIHTFAFAKEDHFYTKGETLLFKKIKDLTIGFTICYDLRFPEIYSILGDKCDLIINIANWPEKRYDHWDTLLKARAIEQQIYMVGVNRTGNDDNGILYRESSKIYDFNGIEHPYFTDEDMKIYKLEKSGLKKFKKKFNTVKDKRNDLYQRLR